MINAKLMFLVLALTNVAVAEDIMWKATGTLTHVEFSNGLITEFPNAAIGTPFSLIFRFDSSSALSSTSVGESGTRYRYFDAPASVSLTVGDIELHRNQEGFDAIDIWDDFAFSGSGDPASDGFNLIWGVNSAAAGGFAQIGLILRGPEHLDLYAGPGLPEEPSPLLLSLALTVVQFIDGGDAVVGNVDNLEQSVDFDSDGVDNVDDNCPENSNPNQEDFDGDGVGYACDLTCATSMDFEHTFNSGDMFDLQTSGSITYEGTIAGGADVSFDAGTGIVLKNGTSIGLGALFTILTTGCVP